MASLNFYFHGVPVGHEVKGTGALDPSIEQFYGQAAKEDLPKCPQLYIRILKTTGKRYVYYTYFVNGLPNTPNSNVCNQDGRPGSYFGMTLRSEEYISDALTIFRAFDCVFNSVIMGTALQLNRGVLQYIAQTLPDANSDTPCIKLFLDILNQDLKTGNARFYPIGDFPTLSTDISSHRINLIEATNEEILKQCKQYGGIAISPYYPSVKENNLIKDCQNRINQIKAQYDQSLTNLENSSNEKIQKIKGQLDTNVHDFEKTKAELDRTSKELKNLKSEKDRRQQLRQINDIAAQLSPEVSELAMLLKSYAPDKTSSHSDDKALGTETSETKVSPTKIKRFLILGGLILVIIVMSALILSKVFSNKEKPHTNQNAIVTEETIDSTVDDNIVEVNQNSDTKYGVTRYDKTYPKAMLDIKELVEPDTILYIGEKITVSAKDIPSEGLTNWIVEGASKQDSSNGKNTVYLTPTDNEVVVTLCVGEKRIVTRKLRAIEK